MCATHQSLHASYQDEVDFLKAHTEVVELIAGDHRVALAPQWQGRVMTSSAEGSDGMGFGWINRSAIETGIKPAAERTGLFRHIHVFGGEERFWLGPEGGPNSLYFEPGAAQEFANWKTPAVIDTEPFDLIRRDGKSEVVFGKSFTLVNRAGTEFTVGLQRKVRLLSGADLPEICETCLPGGIRSVGYLTENQITNRGNNPWRREGGAPSVWMLGMYKPSPQTTMVIPYQNGPVSQLGKVAETAYFGEIPADRFRVAESVVYFKGDGTQRGKIGLGPKRARGIAGSWQADLGVLTLVMIRSQDEATSAGWPYVDSQWRDDVDPFAGDVINAYNDGAPAPGEKPLGPFYELETSSPALFLAPGQSYTHAQVTLHFTGDRSALNALAVQMLGVGLNEIESALP